MLGSEAVSETVGTVMMVGCSWSTSRENCSSFGLGCSSEGGKLGEDGIDRYVVDHAVGNAGVTERGLVVLVVEELLGEESLLNSSQVPGVSGG